MENKGLCQCNQGRLPCSCNGEEPKAQYTAVDMATAAADGFRDGVKSVVVILPGLAGPTKAFNDESMDSGFDEAIEQCREAIIAAGGSVKE